MTERRVVPQINAFNLAASGSAQHPPGISSPSALSTASSADSSLGLNAEAKPFHFNASRRQGATQQQQRKQPTNGPSLRRGATPPAEEEDEDPIWKPSAASTNGPSERRVVGVVNFPSCTAPAASSTSSLWSSSVTSPLSCQQQKTRPSIPQQSSPSPGKEICHFFVNGGCSRGAECPYSHNLEVKAKSASELKAGFVLMGNVKNVVVPQQGKTTTSSSSPEPSSDSSGGNRSPFNDENAAPPSMPGTQEYLFYGAASNHPVEQSLGGLNPAAQEFVFEGAASSTFPPERSPAGKRTLNASSPAFLPTPTAYHPSQQLQPDYSEFQDASGGFLNQSYEFDEEYRRRQAMRAPLSYQLEAGAVPQRNQYATEHQHQYQPPSPFRGFGQYY